MRPEPAFVHAAGAGCAGGAVTAPPLVDELVDDEPQAVPNAAAQAASTAIKARGAGTAAHGSRRSPLDRLPGLISASASYNSAAMANTIKESKGVFSQKDIVTSVRCAICGNLMRQNEISVEIAFRHSRKPGEPKRERILKHAKNCGKAA